MASDRVWQMVENGPVTEADAAGRLYTRTAVGQIVCRLCGRLDRAHAPDCVVLTLHAQVQELASSLGLLVATMRETMDALDQVLRGEP